MMSRRATVLLVTLLTFLLATPVQAITNGTLDRDEHPNVGAVIAIYTPISDEPIVWCSGTLVAPTLFLTAAHCVEDDPELTILGVTFDPVPVDPETGTVVGTVIPVAADGLHPHPGYPGPASDPLDIAIIELEQAAVGISPASLPTLHQFDELARKNGLHRQEFTAVGYGSTGRHHEPGPAGPGGNAPEFIFPDTRMFAVSTFRALNRAWLRLSMNPATGDGGTCYGDSGGPNFLGAGGDETDVIAAITITGDAVCRATNVVYRLDSVSAQSFLAEFGLVDEPTARVAAGAAAKASTDRHKADKGKAKKASKDRNGKKGRGHRR
jgi:hypothetical protein